MTSRYKVEMPRKKQTKKYKVTAGQTIYASYEIEIKASSPEEAEKKALKIPPSDWDDERFENGDALSVDEVEEIDV